MNAGLARDWYNSGVNYDISYTRVRREKTSKHSCGVGVHVITASIQPLLHGNASCHPQYQNYNFSTHDKF